MRDSRGCFTPHSAIRIPQLRECFGRTRQQRGPGFLPGVLLPQEALVGGILKEATHEVGHAGQQLANGAILADATIALPQGGLEFVGHPKERLKLEGALIDAQSVGLGEGVGTGTHIVGGESRGDQADVFQQEDGELLEVRVGFGFEVPDGRWPAALLGENCLMIPIRPFDQSHGDRPLMLPDPREQGSQIGFAIAQVRLERDADGGLDAKLGFLQNRNEESEGEVLQLVTLHVEIHQGANLGGAAEDRTQALLQGGNRVVRIGGMHVGREGGDFQREVQARQRAVCAEVAEAGRGFAGEERGDLVEDLEIAPQKGIRLRLADDRLTQEVNGGGVAELGVVPDLLDQRGRIGSGDELPGEVHDLRFARSGHEGGGERGRAQTELERRVQCHGFVAEILLQVADDLGRGV